VEDNTVNGKPLVYLEDVSDYKVEDAGQVILVNCSNITVENQDLTNTSVGIELWDTEDSTIANNKVCNNSWHGIYLYNSCNNTIPGNTVCSNNWYGIYPVYSSNNNITGNNVSNNWYGIYPVYSSNNNITGNNVSNNSYNGIYLDDSSNTGNVFVNDGLSVYFSYQNIVEDNTVNGKPLVYLEDVSDCKVKDAGQVILVNCDSITIENLNLSNTSRGIALWKTENSNISNNTACNNSYDGIFLSSSSSNNTITGNNVSSNCDGINLESSSNNSITGNNVSNNSRDGICLSSSSNTNITDNSVSNNSRDGIRLYDSSNNSITGNTFVNGGLFVQKSYQNIVEENTINGNPLAYLEDVSDCKVEDAGQVILVNCSNITVENLDLSNTNVGIEFWDTEDSIISNNKVCNNSRYGIYPVYSSNNNITGNNVSNNEEGIHLSFSSNNFITGNNVSNNNKEGISLSYSSNNKIYLNNFINNTDTGYSYISANIWNSPLEITYTYDGTTYKSYLGNCWDDYEGTDADGDGIGDTHYTHYSIFPENYDYYPLMKPFENYILPRSAPA
jgi:parallel beta-helix repeat protein